MKIAICGPNRLSNEEENNTFYSIGNVLAKVADAKGSLLLNTGGTVGAPTRIAQMAKEVSSKIAIVAYTPARTEEEWEELRMQGIAPERALYSSVAWSNSQENLPIRLLQRIPFLIQNSDITLAYLNPQACNTYLEVLQSAGALRKPTYVITFNNEIRRALGVISKGSILLRPEEISSRLEQLLSAGSFQHE